jgi:hypothetical protein
MIPLSSTFTVTNDADDVIGSRDGLRQFAASP